MASDLTTLQHKDWLAEGKRLFGEDMLAWKSKCPSCGNVASVQEYKDVGGPLAANNSFFNCIGRYLPQEKKVYDILEKKGPCNYTSGGFFNLTPNQVVYPDGQKSSVFDFGVEGSFRDDPGQPITYSKGTAVIFPNIDPEKKSRAGEVAPGSLLCLRNFTGYFYGDKLEGKASIGSSKKGEMLVLSLGGKKHGEPFTAEEVEESLNRLGWRKMTEDERAIYHDQRKQTATAAVKS